MSIKSFEEAKTVPSANDADVVIAQNRDETAGRHTRGVYPDQGELVVKLGNVKR